MAETRRLRLLTYNVHSCRGTDGRRDAARIAEVIAACGADVVALQELDVGRARSQGVDQAREIARLLGMDFHFHPALRVLDEQYGDAILTALPARLVKAAALPRLSFPREPRGALWVEVTVDGIAVQIVNTHLGLRPAEQRAQAAALVGDDWLGRVAGPALLVGDFNCWRWTRPYRQIVSEGFVDVPRAADTGMRATFPSGWPLIRIDHIFARGGVEVIGAEVVRTPLTKVASDHLPLVATLTV